LCRDFGLYKHRVGKSREHLHEKHFSDEEMKWSPRERREDKKAERFEKKSSNDKEMYYKQYQKKAYDGRHPGSYERYQCGQERYFGGHQGCIHFDKNDQEWNRRQNEDFRKPQNFNREDFRGYGRKEVRQQMPAGRDREFGFKYDHRYGPPQYERRSFDKNYRHNSQRRINEERIPRDFENEKEKKPLRKEYGKREEKKDERFEERKKIKKEEIKHERKEMKEEKRIPDGRYERQREDYKQPMYLDRREGGYRGYDPAHRFIGW
jgi:hypothetical protein